MVRQCFLEEEKHEQTLTRKEGKEVCLEEGIACVKALWQRGAREYKGPKQDLGSEVERDGHLEEEEDGVGGGGLRAYQDWQPFSWACRRTAVFERIKGLTSLPTPLLTYYSCLLWESRSVTSVGHVATSRLGHDSTSGLWLNLPTLRSKAAGGPTPPAWPWETQSLS